MGNWFHKLRLGVKRLIVWAGLGPCLIEFCDDCGIKQPLVWRADNALWAEIIGKPWDGGREGPGGVLCPTCFDRRAERLGILLNWTAVVEHRHVGIAASHCRGCGKRHRDGEAWPQGYCDRCF